MLLILLSSLSTGKEGRKKGRSLYSSENRLLLYFFFCLPKYQFEASHNDIPLKFPEKENYENCLSQQPLFLIDEEYPNCHRQN